jgi:serine/threonine protein kinase
MADEIANLFDDTTSYVTLAEDNRVINPLAVDAWDPILRIFVPGTLIGGMYRVIGRLGAGGMGKVFQCRDENLSRDVALKVLNWTRHTTRPEERKLLEEASLSAPFQHPGIATVFGHDSHCGHRFIVFEYVQGETLRQVLIRRERLPANEALRILRPLAEAIDHAHSMGIIHRDLKPENICFTLTGQPKILDFGLAQRVAESISSRVYSGTPTYSSPEQAERAVTGFASDQYSLAVIAYEMLTGIPVFTGSDYSQLLRDHREKIPPDLGSHGILAPQALTEVLNKALSKKPAMRYASCQAFVTDFAAAIDATDGPLRVPLSIPESLRIAAYISNANDDSHVAGILEKALDRAGYNSWYFQSNALPGISSTQQVVDAIKRASAFIALISHNSLKSPEFESELRQADRHGLPVVPILIDITDQELQFYSPKWLALLGGIAPITLDKRNPSTTVERIKRTLAGCGLKSQGLGGRVAKGADRAVRKQWATDANQVELDELPRVVYENDVVREFLSYRGKYFLIGTKGLGKTLLLSFKRHKLTLEYQNRPNDQPLCLIPHSNPLLDFMEDMKEIGREYEDFLSNQTSAKRLWVMALRISALSHHRGIMQPDDEYSLNAFPDSLKKMLQGEREDPTLVFKKLIDLNLNHLNQLLDDTNNFLDRKFRRIHSATYFFIDKVDQAVSRFGTKMWIHIQAGLIDAAWELMNTNRHVRIYCTIRQEAFVSYHSDIKANLMGASSILQYTNEDLKEMLDKLAREYERKESFKEFVGLNTIRHPRRAMPEDVFDLMKRHTFGRPRDLVVLASGLAANSSQLSETKFCQSVAQSSTSGLVMNIFDEMRAFLQCLKDVDLRKSFLDSLPSNILSRAEVEHLSAAFNGIAREDLGFYDDAQVALNHPFRDLYLTGLLGCLVRDSRTDRKQQRFRQPHHLITEIATVLPYSDFYFIHPALQNLLSHHRYQGELHFHQHILVGEGADWTPFDFVIWNIERAISNVSDQGVRDAVHEFLRTCRQCSQITADYRQKLKWENSEVWRHTRDVLTVARQDQLLYWCDELRRNV